MKLERGIMVIKKMLMVSATMIILFGCNEKEEQVENATAEVAGEEVIEIKKLPNGVQEFIDYMNDSTMHYEHLTTLKKSIDDRNVNLTNEVIGDIDKKGVEIYNTEIPNTDDETLNDLLFDLKMSFADYNRDYYNSAVSAQALLMKTGTKEEVVINNETLKESSDKYHELLEQSMSYLETHYEWERIYNKK